MTLVAAPPAPLVDETHPGGVGHRLAEFIREGCRLSPIQTRDRLFGTQVRTFGETSSCVMGALYEGLMGTQEIREPVVTVVKERTGVDLDEVRLCHPLYPRSPSHWKLNEILVDLNDRHGWRREEIADWLEEALP